VKKTAPLRSSERHENLKRRILEQPPLLDFLGVGSRVLGAGCWYPRP
jgi:hypothetical protein